MADEESSQTQEDSSLFNEPEKVKKEHKYLKTLLTVLVGIVLIAGVAGGVWYWQQNELKKQRTDSDKQIQDLQKQVSDLKKNQTTTTTTQTNGSTATDETANWLTYTNKTYGYSIKYPKDWKTACNELKDDINYCIYKGDPVQNKDFTASVKVFPNIASDWATTSANTPGSVLKNISTVTFAGVSAVKADFPGGAEYPAVQYRIVHGTNGYLVSVNYVGSRDYSGDPIINTFKFTN